MLQGKNWILVAIPVLIVGLFITLKSDSKPTAPQPTLPDEVAVVTNDDLTLVYTNDIASVEGAKEYNDGRQVYGAHVDFPVGSYAAQSSEQRACGNWRWQRGQPIRNILRLPFRLLQFIFRPRCR